MIYFNVDLEKKNPMITFIRTNGSSYKQTWIPIIQGCFVPIFIEIGLVVLKKIFKIRQYFRYFVIISR